MNHKLRLSPISGTRESRVPPPLVEPSVVPAKAHDAKFFRLRLVYDSDPETIRSRRRIRWSMVLGVALATAFSACFWVGVALMIARIWR
jgi:hypothetical protein